MLPESLTVDLWNVILEGLVIFVIYLLMAVSQQIRQEAQPCRRQKLKYQIYLYKGSRENLFKMIKNSYNNKLTVMIDCCGLVQPRAQRIKGKYCKLKAWREFRLQIDCHAHFLQNIVEHGSPATNAF